MVRLILPLALLLASCSPSTPGASGSASDAAAPPAGGGAPASYAAPVIDAAGEACGGITGVMCPANFYCEKPEGQCLEILDGPGSCQRVPEACPAETRPVCGCNGATYSNACEAAQMGVSIVAQGECGSTDTL